MSFGCLLAVLADRGFSWTYLIWMDDKSGVELYFGNSDADVNKQAFDILASRKSEVEARFGGPLEWERLDTKQAARIRKTYFTGGLSADGKWPEIQLQMIDGLRRLFHAVEQYVPLFAEIQSETAATVNDSRGREPLLVHCVFDGTMLTVEQALELRQRDGESATAQFVCPECGRPVRPHTAGGNMSAHFEHRERNPSCSKSARPK